MEDVITVVFKTTIQEKKGSHCQCKMPKNKCHFSQFFCSGSSQVAEAKAQYFASKEVQDTVYSFLVH